MLVLFAQGASMAVRSAMSPSWMAALAAIQVRA